MKKFDVYSSTTRIEVAEIAAESREDAIAKAVSNRNDYTWDDHNSSDTEYECSEEKVKEKKRFDSLIEGEMFHDSELFTEECFFNGDECSLEFSIIGDHIYSITNNKNLIIIAGDKGNGHGIVLNKVRY